MGDIVKSIRGEKDNVIVELNIDKTEYKQLKGELDNVHMFSENISGTPSRVSLRGRNEATKYFLIPKQLRKRLVINGEVSCQRLESRSGKSIFIYVIDPVKKRCSKIIPYGD